MTRNQILSVAIVDDEPPARRRLERLIAADPGLALTGSYPNPIEARASMPDVDLLLLDIEMPLESGFALLDGLGQQRCRAVIVVTAHARHAVDAFRREAVDFLLKPYDDESFARAVQRARRRLLAADLLSLVGVDRASVPPQHAPTAHPRLRVPEGESEMLLEPRTIAWIRADDKAVLLRCGDRTQRVRGRLREFETRLAAHGFVRVHRSTLVNIAFIHAVRQRAHGDQLLVLTDGSELALSRRYAPRLHAHLL